MSRAVKEIVDRGGPGSMLDGALVFGGDERAEWTGGTKKSTGGSVIAGYIRSRQRKMQDARGREQGDGEWERYQGTERYERSGQAYEPISSSTRSWEW